MGKCVAGHLLKMNEVAIVRPTQNLVHGCLAHRAMGIDEPLVVLFSEDGCAEKPIRPSEGNHQPYVVTIYSFTIADMGQLLTLVEVGSRYRPAQPMALVVSMPG
jgi:hypothetical protein